MWCTHRDRVNRSKEFHLIIWDSYNHLKMASQETPHLDQSTSWKRQRKLSKRLMRLSSFSNLRNRQLHLVLCHLLFLTVEKVRMRPLSLAQLFLESWRHRIIRPISSFNSNIRPSNSSIFRSSLTISRGLSLTTIWRSRCSGMMMVFTLIKVCFRCLNNLIILCRWQVATNHQWKA